MAWGQFLAHDCVATPSDSGKLNIYRTAIAKFEDTTGEIRSCNSNKNWRFYLDFFSFLYHFQDFYQTWLYLWVTQMVLYEKQELLTLREQLCSPPVFGGVRCAHLFYFSVLCLLFVCLRIVSCVPNVASVSALIRITASDFSCGIFKLCYCCPIYI
jgi:hypothetical protein